MSVYLNAGCHVICGSSNAVMGLSPRGQFFALNNFHPGYITLKQKSRRCSRWSERVPLTIEAASEKSMRAMLTRVDNQSRTPSHLRIKADECSLQIKDRGCTYVREELFCRCVSRQRCAVFKAAPFFLVHMKIHTSRSRDIKVVTTDVHRFLSHPRRASIPHPLLKHRD